MSLKRKTVLSVSSWVLLMGLFVLGFVLFESRRDERPEGRFGAEEQFTPEDELFFDEFFPGPPPEDMPSRDPARKERVFVIGLLLILLVFGSWAIVRTLENEYKLKDLQGALMVNEVQLSSEPRVLMFKSARKTVTVPLDKILYVESMSEYVRIYLSGEEEPVIVLYSLKKLVDDLPAERFMRIHRSYIVALEHVRGASASSVSVDDLVTLPVGDMYKPDYRRWLEGRKI